MDQHAEDNGTKTNSKPYDLTTILAICDNNQPFLEKLLVVFADNVALDMQTLKQAASAGNWYEVGQLAHKMKSSLTHFGVNSLKDTISKLEHYGNSDAATLNLLVAEFDSVVSEVLVQLKQEFPTVLNK